jgi:UDP-N-acetyl-D-glucosamine dehydrogenase
VTENLLKGYWNIKDLRHAVNTKWNVQILEPREGIGGHCIPKDTEMFFAIIKELDGRH